MNQYIFSNRKNENGQNLYISIETVKKNWHCHALYLLRKAITTLFDCVSKKLEQLHTKKQQK